MPAKVRGKLLTPDPDKPVLVTLKCPDCGAPMVSTDVAPQGLIVLKKFCRNIGYGRRGCNSRWMVKIRDAKVVSYTKLTKEEVY